MADLTKEGDLLKGVAPGSIDIVTCIFVFSAIPPEKFAVAVHAIEQVLRPGGLVLFRDYSRDDAAQRRFREDRKLSDSLFVRQDGTLAYYFSQDELHELFTGRGAFICQSLDLVHSKTTNIKKDINVDRLFIQAKFCKQDKTGATPLQ